MGFSEGHIEYSDGLKVRYRLNEHQKGAAVVLIHDAGRRLEDYDFLFPYCDTSGIDLHAIEMRGHGLSGGARFHINDFDDYAKDIKRFIYGHLQNRPVYLIGEGTGFFSALSVAIDSRFTVKGIIAISPIFRMKIHFLKKLSIEIIARLLPKSKIYGVPLFEIVPEPRVIAQQTDEDGTIKPEDSTPEKIIFSAGFYSALFSKMKDTHKNIMRMRDIPSLLVCGEEDTIADSALSESIFRHCYHSTQNLKISLCKKCGHDILHDKCRLDYVEKITRWINRQEIP